MDIKCGLNLQMSSVFENMSCCTVPAPPPPPPPLQLPLPVDPVDLASTSTLASTSCETCGAQRLRRVGSEDYGIDQDAPDSPPHAHHIDIALAEGPTWLPC